MVKTIVEFVLPMALVEEGHYEMSVKGRPVKIDISYIQNKEMMQHITDMIPHSDGGGTVKLGRDKHGIANVSKVKMELPESNDPSIKRTKICRGTDAKIATTGSL